MTTPEKLPPSKSLPQSWSMSELLRELDQVSGRVSLAKYDSDSSKISPEDHARNAALLQALSTTGINPLLAKESQSEAVDPEVSMVFYEDAKRREGEYSPSERIGMQYDGFIDVDAGNTPDKE
jgi:hypothetical protein